MAGVSPPENPDNNSWRDKLRDMNSDPEIIQSAYQDALKRLYAALVLQYTDAGNDASKQQEAGRHFSTGLTIARAARDRAIALVG